MYTEIQAVQNISTCDSICGQASVNADTYIEARLYQLCAVSNEKIKIFYEWQNNKERYEAVTNTIVNDFQNYSLHDKTHSKSIVSAIEKFLEKDRIDLLGIGDLWLILNAAYSHDMGMHIKYEEVLELWRENEEFHEYIRRLANHPEMNLQAEARYYLQIHNMLNHKNPMEGMEGERNRITNLTRDWPVKMKKNVMILTNEHFRKKHAQRSREYMQKYQNALGIHVAENRLYKVLGDIACSHGEDFDYIMQSLWKEEDGFGKEKIHPQFVAALLRLGDLLDMDNGRFDIYSIEHFGELPQVSKDHLNKHLALTHLSVNRHQIKAVEEAQDNSTCKLALYWFWMIEEETRRLRENWNTFAPEALGGCTFQCCDLQVYLNGQRYNRWQQERFQVEQKKFMDIMIGDKLYDDPLVFVREYLQNSMDAVKVFLGEQIYSGKSTAKLYKEERINPKERSPLEIKVDYLRDLAIEVYLDIILSKDEEDVEKLKITFKDAGIGIDKECLQVLSVIGTSWKGRKKYSDELSRMSCWLYPTGGFGVGLQSGFMYSDKITIETSPLKDTEGYKITLVSPKQGGNIDAITMTPGKIGTETSLEIDKESMIRNVYEEVSDERREILAKDQSKYADKTEMLNLVLEVLETYIKKTFLNCLFPIVLMYKGDTKMISREITSRIYDTLAETNISFEYDTNEGCAWSICKDKKTGKSKFLVWSYKEQYYGEIILDVPGEDEICYRGIRVGNGNRTKTKLIAPNIYVFLDLYQSNAEDWLLISRSDFKADKRFHVDELAERMFLLYLRKMEEKIKEDGENSKLEESELWAFFAGAFCFPEWKVDGALREKLITERMNIAAFRFVYTGEEGKIEKRAANMTFGKLYQCVSEGGTVFWETNDIGSGQYGGNTIDLKNALSGDSTVAINQKLNAMLQNDASAMVIIRQQKYRMLFEAISCFPKHSVQLYYTNKDWTVMRYMDCEKDGDASINTVEAFLNQIENTSELLPDYLEVSCQEEYAALYVSRLPFDMGNGSFCKNKNIILVPHKILNVRKDGEALPLWELYWESVSDSDIYKSTVSWVLRHPQNEYAFIEKRAVESAYQKLYAAVYKRMEKMK